MMSMSCQADFYDLAEPPYNFSDSPNDEDLTDAGCSEASGLSSDMPLPAFEHYQCFWDLNTEHTDFSRGPTTAAMAVPMDADADVESNAESCFAVSSLSLSLPSDGVYTVPRLSDRSIDRTPRRRRLSESAVSVHSNGPEDPFVVVRTTPGRHRSVSLGSSEKGSAPRPRISPYHLLPALPPADAVRPRSKTLVEDGMAAEGVVVIPEKEPKRPPPVKVPGRACVCCNCTNTPMWRDGRGGMRLCNACGIRWQKYGLCCTNCSYVPRKNERGTICRRCNSELPPPELTKRRVSVTPVRHLSNDATEGVADEDSPESPDKESDDEFLLSG